MKYNALLRTDLKFLKDVQYKSNKNRPFAVLG